MSELAAAAEALERETGGAQGGEESEAAEAVGALIRQRLESSARERVDFLAWAKRIPEPKTGPLDFRRFPFQLELYSQAVARAEEVLIMKASQVGVSALLLRWVLYWADMRGVNSLYVFPKLKQMYDFSDARVRTVILKSAYLQGRIPRGFVQNKGLKQIGNGFVYFRGSESTDDLESVDADALALDEYDNLIPKNVPVAEARLGASQLALMRRVGVPSYPNYGLSKLWPQTDRRRWLVRCPACSAEEPLRWPESVDLEAAVRVCSSCRVPLRSETIAAGRWVPESLERGLPRGYHAPKLIVPHLRVPSLVRASKRTSDDERQSFWNRDLAEPFAPAEGRLSREQVHAAMSEGQDAGATADAGNYQGSGLVTMGVDVASVRDLNVRISEHLLSESGVTRKRCLYLQQVRDFNDLDALMRTFRVQMCSIDHSPEGRLAMAFANRFPGRVYVTSFATEGQRQPLSVKPEDRKASVRRTEAIDATLGMVRTRRNLLPPDAPDDYTDQMTALLRVKQERPNGREVVDYIKTGPVDWAMAEVYDVVAGDLAAVQGVVDVAADFGEQLVPYEDELDYSRSDLDAAEGGYSAGPGDDADDDYSAGPGDE